MNNIAIVTLRNPSEDLINDLRESHVSTHPLPMFGRWVNVVGLDVSAHTEMGVTETVCTVFCQEHKEDE